MDAHEINGLWELIDDTRHDVDMFVTIMNSGIGAQGEGAPAIIGVDASSMLRVIQGASRVTPNRGLQMAFRRLCWLQRLPASILFVVPNPSSRQRSAINPSTSRPGALFHRLVIDFGYDWIESGEGETAAATLTRLGLAGRLDFVLSDDPEPLLHGLGTVCRWPDWVSASVTSHVVRAYTALADTRPLLILATEISMDSSLCGLSHRPLITRRLAAAGWATALLDIAAAATTIGRDNWRASALVQINIGRANLPSSFPNLERVSSYLESAGNPLPRWVLRPQLADITSVIGDCALIHRDLDMQHVYTLLCEALWPGICMRAVVGAARGTGMFATVPLPFHLHVPYPFLYATAIPSLLDFIEWPISSLTPVHEHWPGVAAYRLYFSTSPLLRAFQQTLHMSPALPDLSRILVYVPSSLLNAASPNAGLMIGFPNTL